VRTQVQGLGGAHMKIKRLMIFVMTAIILLSTQANIAVIGHEEYPVVATVYSRIVFVIDVSDSMVYEDPYGIASILPQMFVDIAVSANTEVGFVAFNNTIAGSHPLASLSSQGMRESIKSGIDRLQVGGGADIGIGLIHALNMLSGIPRVANHTHERLAVVLISAGEQTNNIAVGRTIEESLEDKHEALEMAIRYDIPIHTVSLSAVGNFEHIYMSNIANETGGIGHEINNVSELPEVIEGLFEGITGTAITRHTVAGIGSHQLVNIAIPHNHANESNIKIWHNGNIRGARGDYTDSISTTDAVVHNFSHYASIRITNPATSNIVVDFVASTGSEISIFVVNHLDVLPIIMTPSSLASLYIPIKAMLFNVNDSAYITDELYYEGLTAQLLVRDIETGEEVIIPLDSTGAGFEGAFANTNPGQQKQFWVNVSGGSYYATSIPIMLSLTNTPPSVNQTAVPSELMRRNNPLNIDLNRFFYDVDGDTLTYRLLGEIPEIADLQDNVLTLDVATRGHESLLIQVSDGRGEMMEYYFSFEIVPWWVYFRMNFLVIALIFFILLSAYLFFTRRVRDAETKPVIILPPAPTSSNRFSDAKFEGYFLSTLSGNEIPILNWNANYIENKHKISLGEMFSMLDVEERLPEAHKIFFEAGNNNAVIFYHSTSCVVSIGNRDVPKGKKEVLG